MGGFGGGGADVDSPLSEPLSQDSVPSEVINTIEECSSETSSFSNIGSNIISQAPLLKAPQFNDVGNILEPSK